MNNSFLIVPDSDPKEKEKRKDKERDKDKDGSNSNSNREKEKDKEREKDKEKERKKLPDLEKYWRTVKNDPADFTGWTYLLQYVDNEVRCKNPRTQNYICILKNMLFSLTQRPHEKHMMHSYLTIPIAMVTGVNMPIMRSVRE